MMHGLGSIAFAFMENGLAFVVFGAVAFSLLISFLLFATRGTESAYDRIGAGGISREDDYNGGADVPTPESAAARAEQEREIRQMLSARNERLLRSGQPALDVDAELARLLGEEQGEPASNPRDPELLAEVRQLVLARNERRIRQGMDPLDVDVEVARTLDELEP